MGDVEVWWMDDGEKCWIKNEGIREIRKRRMEGFRRN
jgi:hypothetical protein